MAHHKSTIKRIRQTKKENREKQILQNQAKEYIQRQLKQAVEDNIEKST